LRAIEQNLGESTVSPEGEGSKLDFDHEQDLRFGPFGTLMLLLVTGRFAGCGEGFLHDVGTAVTAQFARIGARPARHGRLQSEFGHTLVVTVSWPGDRGTGDLRI